MTYCVGMLTEEGLVFLADTRTNAGVDQINTFQKIFPFQIPGERAIAVMTAGNLGVTQSIIALLTERFRSRHDPSLASVSTLFSAAQHVGDCVREVWRRDGEVLRQFGVDFNVTLIIGGQIQNEPPRLFLVYAAGNFVEATPDTPYFQIGESKYGKPILDRIFRFTTPLLDAAKCALISMDSTLKSNLTVGMPLDLLCYRRDQLHFPPPLRFEEDHPYWQALRTAWSARIQEAFAALPPVPLPLEEAFPLTQLPA
ncbi:MAG: proteasome-type protease [Hydrogenophilus sp.]|nr:proteasome-type protease [Hydrogenophilus sp.]